MVSAKRSNSFFISNIKSTSLVHPPFKSNILRYLKNSNFEYKVRIDGLGYPMQRQLPEFLFVHFGHQTWLHLSDAVLDHKEADDLVEVGNENIHGIGLTNLGVLSRIVNLKTGGICRFTISWIWSRRCFR